MPSLDYPLEVWRIIDASNAIESVPLHTALLRSIRSPAGRHLSHDASRRICCTVTLKLPNLSVIHGFAAP